MAIKRCTESFTIWRDGAPVPFVAGQLVDDKHPILKSHGHLFSDPETAAHPPAPAQMRPVEAATAAPGEQRTLTPPADPGGDGDGKPFDPGAYKAAEVLAYLKNADEDERARVLAAEAEGQKRKGVLGSSTE